MHMLLVSGKQPHTNTLLSPSDAPPFPLLETTDHRPWHCTLTANTGRSRQLLGLLPGFYANLLGSTSDAFVLITVRLPHYVPGECEPICPAAVRFYCSWVYMAPHLRARRDHNCLLTAHVCTALAALLFHILMYCSCDISHHPDTPAPTHPLHPTPHSHLCDLPAFVVATQDGDPVPIAHFESHQQRDCLDTVVPAIHIVPHEEVVCVGAVAADPEQLQQIQELPVDIAANGYRAADWLHVALLHQDFLGLFAEGLYCFLRQGLAFHELAYLLIQL